MSGAAGKAVVGSSSTTEDSAPPATDYSSDGGPPMRFLHELRDMVGVTATDPNLAKEMVLHSVAAMQQELKELRKRDLCTPKDVVGYAVDVTCKKFGDGSLRMLMDLNLAKPELEYLVVDVGYLHIETRTLYMSGINGVTARVVDPASPNIRTHIPDADTLIAEALATKASGGDAWLEGYDKEAMKLAAEATLRWRTDMQDGDDVKEKVTRDDANLAVTMPLLFLEDRYQYFLSNKVAQQAGPRAAGKRQRAE